MKTTSKPPIFYRLTPSIWLWVAAVSLAFGLMPLRNVLRASDLNVEFPKTYQAVDSLYLTAFDPEVSPGKGQGWKPYNRWRWFYGQRSSNGEIPVGSRMTAWENKQRSRGDRILDESWQLVGPTNMAGRMLCIVWHPTNTNIIYAGSASGGLWKTTNGGSSWFPLTDDLPSLAVGTVALDPTNPNIVYIGTGEGAFNVDAVFGAGVFKSTDGGSTWNSTGLNWTQSQKRCINKIVIDPTNPQTVYAACGRYSYDGGVYKSTNGGSSWILYHSGDVKDLEMDPTNPSILYAVGGYPWGSSMNGVWKSTDAGVSWTSASSGLPSPTTMGRAELDVSPSNPQVLYLGVAETISGGAGLKGFYRSTDGGASWTLQSSSPNMYSGQGWYNIVTEVHPTDPNTVFSSGIDCYKSTDGGVNWSRKTYWSYPVGHSQYAHADHHALAFQPGNPNVIIIGTDGGMFKSTDGGSTWTDLNTNLATFQFYAMGNDALNPTVCFGGTQDNGTNKHTGGTSWSNVLGGDGGFCNVDYTNSNIVYAEYQYGQHKKSTNGGSSWTTIMNGITGNGPWVTPVVMHPTNPLILYTTHNNPTGTIARTSNGGSSWTDIAQAGSLGGEIVTIAIATSNPQVLYVGKKSNGKIYRSSDGGYNWAAAYTGLPNATITEITVDPTNSSVAFATVSGYGFGHVYKTTNGGSSWSSSATGLPDLPANAIEIDPSNPQNLYVGTDIGVYASTNSGASWSDFSSGMPNVVVDDLALHATARTLRAATHGRGMWETSIGTPSVTVITPNGGETWTTGSAHNITWGTGGIGGNVKIEINRSYPSGSWSTITSSTSNDGSYSWTVTAPVASTARIRITSLSEPSAVDESNANFTIDEPSISLTSPNGGESWAVGTTHYVSWDLTGVSGNVLVYINRNYPSGSWSYLTTQTGSGFNWTVSGPASSHVRLLVYPSAYSSARDTSAADFAIVDPSITVDYPNGGEVWTPGETRTIRWSTVDLTGNVKVEINRSYPSGSWETIQSVVSADSLVWTVDQSSSASVRIRVKSVDNPGVLDESDNNLTILTPTLTVTAPNGGEVWNTGTTQTVSWNRANLSGPVNVYINTDYPVGSWNLIAVGVMDNAVSWTVVQPFTVEARVRVTSVNISSFYDESDGNFTVADGSIELNIATPNGSEDWGIGTVRSITWSRLNAPGPVTVQVNRNHPSGTWETLSTSETTTSMNWTVTGPPSTAARVKVYLNSDPDVSDISNQSFSIIQPALTLTSPSAGAEWTAGTEGTVNWTRTAVTGNVTVQVDRNYPSGSWETLTTSAGGNSYAWSITPPGTDAARIRVFLTSNTDIGDTTSGNFTILSPVLTLLQPNGGEAWNPGDEQVIRFNRDDAVGPVAVLLNRNYPSGSWETLSTAVTADTLAWTVTGPTSMNARIRLYMTAIPAVGDTSDGDFIIADPQLTVVSPNGGETWTIGQPHQIILSRSYADGPVSVQFNNTYPTGSWQQITASAVGDTVIWTPSAFASSSVRVRATLNGFPQVQDISNANFSLVNPALMVDAPDGGDTLVIGEIASLEWTRYGADGVVTVSLNRDYPSGSWEDLSTDETGNQMNWLVTGPVTEDARLRVLLNSNPALTDVSDAEFNIFEPTLELLSPVGGGEFTLGGPLVVRWSRVAAYGYVTVSLNRNYPAGSWETLTASADADSFVWTAAGSASSSCRFKIHLTADESVNDLSGENFALVERQLQLTSHHSGIFYIGASSPVTFTRTNAPGGVTIEINRDYPSGQWETLAGDYAGTSLPWTVNGPVTDHARIRVSLSTEPYVFDISDDDFSIEDASLEVATPNGGEVWAVGSDQTIAWRKHGVSGDVRVYLNRTYPTGSWEQVAASVSDTFYQWTVSGPAASQAKIKVVSVADGNLYDMSDGTFEISYPNLSLIGPAPGTTLNIGFPAVIEWSRLLADGEVTVELNRSFPSSGWEAVGSTEDNSLPWTPAGASSADCRLRIYLTADPGIGDTTAGNFTLHLPVMTVTSPQSGERILQGTAHEITWQRDGLTGPVKIELNTDYPVGAWEPVAAGLTGDSYTWNVPATAAASARVRITHEQNGAYSAETDDFSIVAPVLSVISPDGGELFVVGTSYSISFTRVDHPEPVRVELNRNYPSGSWEMIAENVTASSVEWTASGPPTIHARIRVVSEVFPTIEDQSAADFSILEPGVTVVEPEGGEALAIGTDFLIQWQRVLVDEVDVLINRTYPTGSWEILAENLNTNQWLWQVEDPASERCRVRVRSHVNPGLYGESSSDFEVEQPVVMIVKPAPGDFFAVGVSNRISWLTSASVTGSCRIDIDRNYPSGSWTELGTTEDDLLDWIADGPETGTARLRVVSLELPWVGDTLDFDLHIEHASLVLTSPVSLAAYGVDDEILISWERENIGPGVNVYLSRNYPASSWELVAGNVQSDYWSWIVTPPRTTGARFRINSVSMPSLGDTSAAQAILIPGIELLSPNGGTFAIGEQVSVSWQRTDFSGSVAVDVDFDYPSGWTEIANGLTGDSFDWTVTGLSTGNARFRVRSEEYAVQDVSSGDLSFLMPSLTVLYPNGGEILNIGENLTVTWSRSLVEGNVKVELNRDYPEGSWETLAASVAGNSFTWTMTGDEFIAGRIRVSLAGSPEIFDLSDGDFGTRLPDIYIINPNGGETLIAGEPYTVRWGRANAPGRAKLELNRDYPGGTWEAIVSATYADSVEWTVSEPLTESARFKVSLMFNPSVYDRSDENFTIAERSLELLTPEAGDSLIIGRDLEITWQGIGLEPDINVYVKRNYPSGQWSLLGSNVATESLLWTVEGPPSSTARFRVVYAPDPTVSGMTDGAVVIGEPLLQFTAPAENDTLVVGHDININWLRDFADGPARLEISRDGEAGPWTELTTTDGSSYAWTVTEPVSDDVRFRIALVDYPDVSAVLPYNVVVVEPSLTLTEPQGGQVCAIGRDLVIAWQRHFVDDPVDVILDRGGLILGQEVLRSGVTGDSIHWTVTGPPAGHVHILVRTASGLLVQGETRSAIVLDNPAISLLSPAAGEEYLKGDNLTVSWSRYSVNDAVSIDLNRNYPASQWESLAAGITDTVFNWTVTGPSSQTARFRVVSEVDPQLGDTTGGDLSLIVPALSIITPQAASRLPVGFETEITWQREGVSEQLEIHLSRDGGQTYSEELTSSVSGTAFIWTPDGSASENARLRLRSTLDPELEAESDVFEIVIPSIEIESPLGGEVIALGGDVVIRFARLDHPAPVDVYLNRNYPAGDWELLAENIAADSLTWLASGEPTDAARIRVTSTVNPAWYAESAADFTLAAPVLLVTAPAAGLRLPVGFETEITWSRTANDDQLAIYLSRDGGETYPEEVAPSVEGESFMWTPSGSATEQAVLRLESTVDPELFAESEPFILAVPVLTVYSPAPGESFALNSELVIHFSRLDHPAPVNVLLNRDYPQGAWELLSADVDADSLVWTASGEPADHVRILVQSAVNEDWWGESSGDFSLVNESIAITSPASGDSVFAGEDLLVTWDRIFCDDPVRVLINRGGERTDLDWNLTGSETEVEIPSLPADAAWIVVQSQSNPPIADSAQVVGPLQRELTILNPVEGTRWIRGQTEIIRWARTFAPGQVFVSYNPDYPGAAWVTIDAAASDSLLWTPDIPPTESLAIRISLVSRPDIADTVMDVQIVEAALELSDPPETAYRIGSDVTVQWSAVDVAGDYRLSLNRAYPTGVWEDLYLGPETSYMWIVSGDSTSHARVAVASIENPLAADTLDFDLTLYRPSLMLQVQNEFDTLYIGREVGLELSFEYETLPARIELQREPEGAWEILFDGVTGGVHAWTVTGSETDQARLRAYVPGDSDFDDTTAVMPVGSPSLQFTYEPPSELIAGAVENVSWLPLGDDGPFDLILLRTEGDPETLTSALDDVNYDWTVSAPASGDARLVVLSGSGLSDTTVSFAVRVPALVFTNPVESGIDTVGSILELSWIWEYGEGAVMLEMSRDSMNGEWTTLAESIADGHYSYTVDGPETDSLRFRITSVDNPEIVTVSVARSVVEPALILNVAGGGTWYVGEQHWIRWTGYYYEGPVDIEVSRGDRAEPWEELAAVQTDSFLWTVTGPVSEFAALRVTACGSGTVTDTTDTPFEIREPAIEIVAPDGGEILNVGDEIRIRWVGEGFPGGVRIGLWRGEPIHRADTLFLLTENDSSEIWTVTGPAAEGCYVIVMSAENEALYDSSASSFMILAMAAEESGELLPVEFALDAPWPNPFNSSTNIRYAVPRSGHVRLDIYNVMGRHVETLVSDVRSAGYYTIPWDAADAASGLYFVRMRAGDFSSVKKVHLIR